MCEIKNESIRATEELIAAADLKQGSVLVVGCSSSEIAGGHIGHNSDPNVAQQVFDGIYQVLNKKKIFLAAQCCEHLNRALIVERQVAEKFNLEIVSVVPKPKAGGSFATAAYNGFSDPVAVEYIKADAGMDIGGTLIGMHLKHVAVPVRLSINKIGNANILCAYTRPKYIGGERAQYK